MWNWITRWGTITREKADQMAITVRPTAAVSGKYVCLYTYLANRYADVIVLTFGQIEDVLGFALPTLAHTYHAWWTLGETNVEGPRHSDAWTLAGRTATPNLKARTVVFERTSTARPGLQLP
jgi:hypothetical protein